MSRIKVLFFTLSLVFFFSLPAKAHPAADQPPPYPDVYQPSDSPYLRLTPEELNRLVPMPYPTGGSGPFLAGPSDAVAYDMTTGQETLIPAFLGQESSPGDLFTPSNSGILPADWGSSPSVQLTGILSPDSVIGTDDRQRITDTTAFPYRSIAWLDITWSNGTGGTCTGWFVDNFHIVTAGHCVFNYSQGLGWASSVLVMPGANGASLPYGTARGTGLRSYTAWTNDGNTQHDWGMVTLDRNVGSFLGWMGRATFDPADSHYTSYLVVTGYPGDQADGTLWWDQDLGNSADDTNHWYPMDTAGGQSGAPVYYTDVLSGNIFVVTVHTCGTGGCGIDAKSVNHGTRLNGDKYNMINTWRLADTAPTDRADLIDDGNNYSGYSHSVIKPGMAGFNVYNNVRNIGTATAVPYTVSYYASADTTITTGDLLIGSRSMSSLNAFNWSSSSYTGAFPFIPDGLYYIGWIVDRTGAVTEFDETNNTAYKTSRVRVDGTNPTNPTSANSGCGALNDTWQNSCSDPNFTWTGAADSSGSGVSGYHYYWGTSSTGTTSTFTANAAYNPPAVSSPATYYLRVRTLDVAGNASDWTTLFTFRYDTSLPGAPSAISSYGHFTSQWSLDNTVNIGWSGAADPAGISGYSVLWNNTSNSLPDTTQDTTSSSNTSAALATGNTWYVHVRSRDNAGNWSASAIHLGPFWIDTSLPSSAVDPLPATSPFVFPITWHASDTGSGAALFSIQYKVGTAGAWQDWKTNVPDLSALFQAPTSLCGQSLSFQVKANDLAGNAENYPGGSGDTSTTLDCILYYLPLTQGPEP